MRRRSFAFIFAAATLAAGASALNAQTYQPNWASLDTRPVPAWFTDAKFGIFIHWGVYSVPAYAPVIPGKLAYAEWYWHAMTEGKDNPKRQRQSKPAPGSITRKCMAPTFPYQDFAPEFKRSTLRSRPLGRRLRTLRRQVCGPHFEAPRRLCALAQQGSLGTWGRPWNAVEIGPQRDLLGDLTDAVRRKGLQDGCLLFAL